jgi:hypothetical protein
MQIGNPKVFAIECHHDPIQNGTKHVFGRMCIHAEDKVLGNIDEPACMLNVTEGFLVNLLSRLQNLEGRELSKMPDLEAFKLLDNAVYLDDDRTSEQVASDAAKYFKFDFLTNGGESFDGTKSFVHRIGNIVRILFTDKLDRFHSIHVERKEFEMVITQFLRWLEEEGQAVPAS